MQYPRRIQVKTKTQAQLQRQWVEHYALSYSIEIKSIFLFSTTQWQIGKIWAEVTQWCLYKSSGCKRIEKSNSVLRTCRNENSGFALIIFLDNSAKCTVAQSKMLYRCESVRLQKFGFARFRSQMENSWPNHKMNGNSRSPKSLIQANNGPNSELVKCWFAPFGAVLLGRRFMETKCN